MSQPDISSPKFALAVIHLNYDKISECYDQPTNPAFKKFVSFRVFSLLIIFLDEV